MYHIRDFEFPWPRGSSRSWRRLTSLLLASLLLSFLFLFLFLAAESREQGVRRRRLQVAPFRKPDSGLGFKVWDVDKGFANKSLHRHLSCRSQGYFLRRAIDERLLNDSASWFGAIELGNEPSSVRVLGLEELGGEGFSRSRKRRRGLRSKVELVANAYYELSDFCVRPFDYGGLSFFGNESFAPDIRVCAEMECLQWPFTLMNKGPPPNAIWVDSASAVVPLFTARNPWHTLQFLILLTRLLHSKSSRFRNSSVHLYPGHVIPRNRTHRQRKTDIFSNASYSLWPLLKATAPPDVSVSQVNLLEGPFMRNARGRIPTVCYSSGFFGTTRAKTHLVKPSPGILFSDVPISIVKKFQENAIKLANAKDIHSGWCPNGQKGPWESTPPSGTHGLNRTELGINGWNGTSEMQPGVVLPRLAFVLRKKRIVCNIDVLIAEAQLAKFDVQLLVLEQMNVFEQIKAVRQIDVLVGMHGAGLTHVFWMNKGSVLIEIYPPNGPSNIRSGLNVNKRSNYGMWTSCIGVSHLVWKDPRVNDYDSLWRNNDVVMNVSHFKLMLSTTHQLLNKKKCPPSV